MPVANMSCLKKLTATESAYIAGIIDGEGCITIIRTASGPRCEAARLALRLVVGHTDKPLLEWLHRVTGVGHIGKHGKPAFPNQKDAWEWRVCSRQAVELLFEVLPYLRIKVDHVSLAVEFANTMLQRGCHPLTPETKEFREWAHQQMKLLNTRGRHASA